LSQERRLRSNIQQTTADLERAKAIVADPSKAEVAQYYETDIKKYVEADLPKHKAELEVVEQRKIDLKESVITEEKFVKLIENAVNYIGDLQDLAQIDEILTKFYSNFVILDKSVSVITFNHEWYDVLNPAWLSITV
jgi:hypothetical protein